MKLCLPTPYKEFFSKTTGLELLLFVPRTMIMGATKGELEYITFTIFMLILGHVFIQNRQLEEKIERVKPNG